ncbi:UDP-N-acetylmuramate dehydrogenase [Oxalobacteraceae bacterium R-40]|uniref:UDP-N-acetylenolpyruvoylglucosamine reductase n=1 Tax=Keguizhuia sedimenti TaxID=3064264 RepID=A0ABU1BP38_9BURK|nr:UDP-N-acetylmuramate dehydrogenase [Oxalobacteraceae bacterium R-40]
MASRLPIQTDFSLRHLNTFGIDAKAHAYVRVDNAQTLVAVNADAELSQLQRLILGGGSNIVLTGDFAGLVLHLCNRGIELVDEDENSRFVRAAAGENWHGFVQWTLERGFGGLENLSLIPGSVGASPIQNIGAYGVEIKERLHSLTAFDFETCEILTLSNADCNFAYRDSIFKHELRDRAVILSVTFALPKHWQPSIRYADVAQELAAQGIDTPTARQVSEAVIAIRTRKLPDPAQIGNAGSFFKNPVVSGEERDALLARFPQMVSFVQPDGSYKLAAGWLIDQCGWKGKALGAAGVYEKQALVLVNRGNAKGQDIVALAEAIREDVRQRFGVLLEAEPIFV